MPEAIAWDVETLPTDDAMALPYPEDRQPPSNYTTPEAKAKWLEKDRKDWEASRIKSYSVNPRLGRLCAIGFCTDEGPFHLLAKTEADEAPMLTQFWRIMAPVGGDHPLWVTWNGSFDVRFVILRSIKHGVKPSWAPSMLSQAMARYRVRPHFDAKAVLMQWDVRQQGEGLSEWCAFFGMPTKIADGAAVYGMAQRGEWAEIGAYAEDDAAKNFGIYQKIGPYFL